MGKGTLIRYRLHVHRVPVNWLTEITAWEPPYRFVDEQIKGPYALWHHTHTFEALADGGTLMRESSATVIGFGPLGALANRLLVRRDIEAIFEFRAQRVPELLAGRGQRAAARPEHSAPPGVATGMGIAPAGLPAVSCSRSPSPSRAFGCAGPAASPLSANPRSRPAPRIRPAAATARVRAGGSPDGG